MLIHKKALYGPLLALLISVLAPAIECVYAPPKFCVETLNPNVRVFGVGVFGSYLGHEGSTLIKETPESILVPFCHVRTQ